MVQSEPLLETIDTQVMANEQSGLIIPKLGVNFLTVLQLAPLCPTHTHTHTHTESPAL